MAQRTTRGLFGGDQRGSGAGLGVTQRAVPRVRGLRAGAPHTAPHAGPGAAPLRSGAAPAGGARKRGRAVGGRGAGRGRAKWRRVSSALVPRGAAASGCSSRAPPSSSLSAPRWALRRRALPRLAPPRRRGRRRRRPLPRSPRGRPASPAPPRPAPLRPEARMPEAAAVPSRGLRGERRRRAGRGRCGAAGAGGAPPGSCGKLLRFLSLRRAKPAAPPSVRSHGAAALPPRTCRPTALGSGSAPVAPRRAAGSGRPGVLSPLSAGERRQRRARVA